MFLFLPGTFYFVLEWEDYYLFYLLAMMLVSIITYSKLALNQPRKGRKLRDKNLFIGLEGISYEDKPCSLVYAKQ